MIFFKGNSNAYTTESHTNYFYKVISSQLGKSLRIFSHMFIDPIFRKDGIEKESSAVNSEYEIDIN